MKRRTQRSRPTTRKVGWGRERWVIIWRGFTSWPGYPVLTVAWLLALVLWISGIVPDDYGYIAVRAIGFIVLFAVLHQVRLRGGREAEREFARTFGRIFWPGIIVILLAMGAYMLFGR